MTNRERFQKAMHYGFPDRAPYFEEGIRETVLHAWRQQGLPSDTDLQTLFPSDPRLEIELDLSPRPAFKRWPHSKSDLNALRRRLDPEDPNRLPPDWKQIVRTSPADTEIRMLKVQRGFFISMGVKAWDRFLEIMYLLTDDPQFIREYMYIQGEFAALLIDRVLDEIKIDAAIFSEPIGGNDRPLISPQMYAEFVLKSYQPIIEVLHRHAIETLIWRTYANARLLIPKILEYGFNCLWACEVNMAAMDYRDLRKEYGRDLRLIGGIDLDALQLGKEAIKREVLEKVPALLADGGYVPLADGRVREDVSFENYRFYRKLLKQTIDCTSLRSASPTP